MKNPVVIVAILLAAAGGVWFFFFKDKGPKQTIALPPQQFSAAPIQQAPKRPPTAASNAAINRAASAAKQDVRVQAPSNAPFNLGDGIGMLLGKGADALGMSLGIPPGLGSTIVGGAGQLIKSAAGPDPVGAFLGSMGFKF